MQLEEHEEVVDRSSLIADAILKCYVKVGRPAYDLDSQAFWFVIDNIVQAWINLYKQEYEYWIHDRQIDLDNERSLKDTVKANGFSRMGAYPPTLLKMLRAFFPDAKTNDKDFQIKFFNRYPLFTTTNNKL